MAWTPEQYRAEIERKVASNLPLEGDQNGYINPAHLAIWQQLMTAKQAATTQGTTNQTTGGGVGMPTPPPTYPGNNVVPDLTSDAVKGYGFTAIVGLGVALLVVSLLSAFRRVRGR